MSREIVSTLTSKPLILLSVVACLTVPIVLGMPPKSPLQLGLVALTCEIATYVVGCSFSDYLEKNDALAAGWWLLMIIILLYYVFATS